MKLSVPANYDETLLPFFKDHSVSEVYGKLPSDVVGGGRPSYMTTPLSKGKLSRYMNAVKAHGLEFNYLLNSACYGNEEWTRRWQKQVHQLLDWLSTQQVPWVTTSTPYLTQLIKKFYPHFKVKIGIYAQVDTVKRAKYWEDLGADAINLESFSINRNFDKLAAIRAAVKVDLPLIANHFCQPNCPYQIQHQNAHAHASTNKAKFLIDYPIIQCQHARLQQPRLMISSGWIRPEDLHVYEELGYTTFKLLERNIPSDALRQRVEAYHNRSFTGNFAELIFSWGFKKPAHNFGWLHFAKYFQPWKVRPGFMGSVSGFMQSQGMLFPQKRSTAPITIDTTQLPKNFLNQFKTSDCNDKDCNQCGYCGAIASRAVRIEPEFLQQVLPLYEKVQADLIAGNF